MKQPLLTFLILIFSTIITFAQDTCPAIDSALLNFLETCADAEIGTVCYGAGEIMIESDDENRSFESIAETALLSNVMSIESRSEDALALIQLNREDVSLQIIAYGETSLENIAPRNTIEVYALRGVNVRQSPSVEATVIASLSQGRDYTAIGRLSDNTWIQIRLEDGRIGWSSAQYFVTQDSFTQLEAVTPISPSYLPMQALSLQTEPCSGLLLIAPGIEEESIIFGINEAQISVTGIVHLQTAEDILQIISITGENTVNTFGFEISLEAGERTNIPLSDSGTIAGIASEPEISELAILEDETINTLLNTE